MTTSRIFGTLTAPGGPFKAGTVIIETITAPGSPLGSVAFVPGSDSEIVGRKAVTANRTTGAWQVDLIPNAEIAPSTSYYRATYVIDGKEQTPFYFDVPVGGGPYHVYDRLIVTPAQITGAGTSGRQVGYTRVASNLTTSSTSLADMTGASLAVPIGVRPIAIKFVASYITSDTADKTLVLSWYDMTAAAEIGRAVLFGRTVNGPMGGLLPFELVIDPLPAAGIRTYKIQWAMGEAGGTRNVWGNGFLGAPTYAYLEAVER